MFQQDPRWVEAGWRPIAGSPRRCFSRTLVGLKRVVRRRWLSTDHRFSRTLVGLKRGNELAVEVVPVVFQQDPRWVEARSRPTWRTSRSSFQQDPRWVEAPKPRWGDANCPRFSRTLVGLKQGNVRLAEHHQWFQQDPRWVEASCNHDVQRRGKTFQQDPRWVEARTQRQRRPHLRRFSRTLVGLKPARDREVQRPLEFQQDPRWVEATRATSTGTTATSVSAGPSLG